MASLGIIARLSVGEGWQKRGRKRKKLLTLSILRAYFRIHYKLSSSSPPPPLVVMLAAQIYLHHHIYLINVFNAWQSAH